MGRRSYGMNLAISIGLVLAMLGTGCGSVADPGATLPPETPESTTTTTSHATSTTVAAETTTTTKPPTTVTSTLPPAATTTTTHPELTTTSAAILPPGSELVALVSVTDGDTIDVRFADGSIDTVRLIGINTPEKGECFAGEASAALAGFLPEDIVMTSDTSDRDQYGRLLRYLWTTGGASVNELMVEGGFALAREYPPDTQLSDVFSAAQDRASGAHRGLWASDACGAADVGTVEVGHIEYDAPGNDHDNLNGEWVELTNPGTGSVDMTGWVLKDESASHRYRFRSGFTLSAGASVEVYTGCGSDTATALYWCNGSAVWNNSGDTAFIVDASGNIVDSKSY